MAPSFRVKLPDSILDILYVLSVQTHFPRIPVGVREKLGRLCRSDDYMRLQTDVWLGTGTLPSSTLTSVHRACVYNKEKKQGKAQLLWLLLGGK